MAVATHRYITSIGLKYGTGASPLSSHAFAHLVAKALFVSGKPCSQKEVRHLVTQLVDVTVQRDLIGRGLDHLHTSKWAIKEGQLWRLTERAEQEIRIDIQASDAITKGVLQRHFQLTPEEDHIRWFQETSTVIFGKYDDQNIQKLSSGHAEAGNFSEIITDTAKKYSLTDLLPQLITGYSNFLGSVDPQDHVCLASIGKAVFSARLITANIGVDLKTLDELRGSIVFMDTNLLLDAALGLAGCWVCDDGKYLLKFSCTRSTSWPATPTEWDALSVPIVGRNVRSSSHCLLRVASSFTLRRVASARTIRRFAASRVFAPC